MTRILWSLVLTFCLGIFGVPSIATAADEALPVEEAPPAEAPAAEAPPAELPVAGEPPAELPTADAPPAEA
ncbi:MAG: hypothetical protein AAB152_17180, partial [Candidatus Coatesbacteria bacterium]